MCIPEYSFTLADGWHSLPRTVARLPRLPQEHDAGDVLFQLGYKIMGQSPEGRCALGHFLVWQRDQDPPSALPRYALEIRQAGDESVVWIGDIPALWEFLRLYGSLGLLFQSCLPGDHEEDDEDDEPSCDLPTRPPTLGTLLPFEIRKPDKFN